MSFDNFRPFLSILTIFTISANAILAMFVQFNSSNLLTLKFKAERYLSQFKVWKGKIEAEKVRWFEISLQFPSSVLTPKLSQNSKDILNKLENLGDVIASHLKILLRRILCIQLPESLNQIPEKKCAKNATTKNTPLFSLLVRYLDTKYDSNSKHFMKQPSTVFIWFRQGMINFEPNRPKDAHYHRHCRNLISEIRFRKLMVEISSANKCNCKNLYRRQFIIFYLHFILKISLLEVLIAFGNEYLITINFKVKLSRKEKTAPQNQYFAADDSSSRFSSREDFAALRKSPRSQGVHFPMFSVVYRFILVLFSCWEQSRILEILKSNGPDFEPNLIMSLLAGTKT